MTWGQEEIAGQEDLGMMRRGPPSGDICPPQEQETPAVQGGGWAEANRGHSGPGVCKLQPLGATCLLLLLAWWEG